MSNRIPSQPSTGAQRVVRSNSNPNEPTACRMCGSIYFMDVTAQMYASSHYGLQAVSATPMKIFICPCGEILTPPELNSGTQVGGERDLFIKSLATALAHRADVEAAATSVAGVQALEELRAKIAELQTQVDQLPALMPTMGL